MQDIYIIDGARTASGTFMGSFSDVSAVDLGVVATKGALERSKVDPNLIDQVVIGNVIQSSKDAGYLARHVALKAGLPIDAPALTVNRLCGSGMQAIVSVAQFLLLGDGNIGLAGGTENMTQAPYVLRDLNRVSLAVLNRDRDDLFSKATGLLGCACRCLTAQRVLVYLLTR